MINPETLTREKLLFSYTLALEQGDFARLEQILEQAAGDPILERQIMEINAALSPAQGAAAAPLGDPTSTVSTGQRVKTALSYLRSRPLWRRINLGSAAIALGVLFVVTAGVLALLGPAIGKVFSNVSMYGPPGPGGYPYSAAATAAPAYKSPAATPTPDRYLAPYSAYPAPLSQSQQFTPQARLIVRSGSLSLAVKDTRLARQAALDLIAQYAAEGAFVVSSNETYPYGSQMPAISMSLRVPVKRYDESMNRLAELASEVLRRQETAQDVSQSYVDVSARIEALQVSRERLLAIVKDAKNTDDLLRAEQELSRREAELEAAKANQQYLAQTAALSSITLDLRPVVTSQPVTDSPWNPAATFHNAVQALLKSLISLADGSIYFTIATLPWLVGLGLLAYGVFRLVWARRRK